MYWIYTTDVLTWRNQYVQAKLISPLPRDLIDRYGKYGYRSGLQDEPYGADIELTYQIDVRHPHPDNYFQSASFSLYSARLIELMLSFGVNAEVFPATMVDKDGTVQPQLEYFIFHSLEGVIDAMDEAASQWTGDHDVGIPRLVLDYERFEHRPIFKCNHVYVQLMHDDVRQEIRRQRITGFSFLAPQRFRSGSYGSMPEFDD